MHRIWQDVPVKTIMIHINLCVYKFGFKIFEKKMRKNWREERKEILTKNYVSTRIIHIMDKPCDFARDELVCKLALPTARLLLVNSVVYCDRGLRVTSIPRISRVSYLTKGRKTQRNTRISSWLLFFFLNRH